MLVHTTTKLRLSGYGESSHRFLYLALVSLLKIMTASKHMKIEGIQVHTLNGLHTLPLDYWDVSNSTMEPAH